MSNKRVMHYWTGYGTLCSLNNSVAQLPSHTDDRAKVTCRYCLELIRLNRKKP